MGALALSLVVAACGSAASSDRAATTRPGTATTVTDPARPAFDQTSAQPAGQPIRVALGTAFELVLPANARGGFSWQAVAPPDPAILLSIGSTFRPLPPTTTTTAAPTTTVPATTTTTIPPTTTTTNRHTTTTSAATTTTVPPTTTTTMPPGATAQQVLLYAGRAPGNATITLRYAQPKAGSAVLDTLTFAVVVFDPSTTTAPPPPPSSTSSTR